MNKKKLSRGVLLINVGTPNAPTTKSVRKYLKEFLSDKRIIDIFWLFRLLLVYFIILPIRSKKSAILYKNIWTAEGSPLLKWTKVTKEKLQEELGSEYKVSFAMGYGQPSIPNELNKFYKDNIQDLTIVPLFPQYAASTTGSVIEGVSKQLSKNWHILPYRFVGPFFQNSYFIAAQKDRLLPVLEEKKPDFILFSYHGLPIRHLQKSNEKFEQTNCLASKSCCENYTEKNHFCYKAQCYETTKLIAEECSLMPDHYMTAFQSRFGRDKWTTPDTQNILGSLREKGISKLVVVCPGFVADCLETLEEIELRLAESWHELGGTELVLVESLNDNKNWIYCLKDIICNENAGFSMR